MPTFQTGPFVNLPDGPAVVDMPIIPGDGPIMPGGTRMLYVGTSGNLELTLVHSFSANGLLPAAINTSKKSITIPNHGFLAGDRVMVANAGGALPGGLAAQTPYYVIVVDVNTIQLAATVNGAAITLANQGSGTLSVFRSTQYANVPVGLYQLAVKQVNAATTAGNIVGLY